MSIYSRQVDGWKLQIHSPQLITKIINSPKVPKVVVEEFDVKNKLTENLNQSTISQSPDLPLSSRRYLSQDLN